MKRNELNNCFIHFLDRPDRPDRPDQPEKYPGGGGSYNHEYMGMGGVSSGSVGGYRPYGMFKQFIHILILCIVPGLLFRAAKNTDNNRQNAFEILIFNNLITFKKCVKTIYIIIRKEHK